MKKKFLFFGAIFVFFGICARAQVYDMYYQGFESSDAANYTTSPTGNTTIATDLVKSGSGAIKMQQSTTSDVEFVTDMLDFTQYPSANYIKLEFDHISNIARWSGNYDVCQIQYKLESDATWTKVTETQYNLLNEYSRDFITTKGFSRASYTEWSRATLDADCWKSERFDFETLFQGTATQDRKVQFKFVIRRRSDGNTPVATQAWWIDNIRISASPNEMVDPIISMVCYPDGGSHPSSRGARVELDARTSVAQGICSDSVYIVYTVGCDSTPIRATMTPMGTVTDHANKTWRRFGFRIPFYGYDTTMRFYCVVMDSTTNFNKITYPQAANSWVEYHCVRGVEQPGIQTTGFVGTSNYEWVPFPKYADNMSEWVFDSALMAQAGYGPGAITDLRFTVGTRSTQAQTRPEFQFRMRNMPASYVAQSVGTDIPWTSGYMHVVYDSTLVLPQMEAGTEFTIHLADTFYYAGGDLVMQTIYNGGATDPVATSIKMIPAPTGKQTKEYNGKAGAMNDNPYTNSSNDFTNAHSWLPRRPAIVMTQHANKPLIYDMGVSHVIFPSYETPVIDQPSHLDIMLNNYGVSTINAVRISYSIDDSISGHFDWNGSLASGDSVSVTINSNLTLPAGFHFVRTWVEDSLTVSGTLYRDHEPYNDSSYEEFIVCDGSLAGVRQIGGENADYNTIEELLFSLSRCGVGDSLVVKLSPGSYPPFTLPEINGHSAENYIVFESLDPENEAVLYADATTNASYIVDLSGAGNIRFRNVTFVRRGGLLTGMVNIGIASDSCRFEGCLFVDSVINPSASERIPSLLNTNFADHIVVEGCTFVGGTIGLSIQGEAVTVYSEGNSVVANTFRNQYNTALYVQNQTDVVIEGNEMYDVMSNQSNILQVLECSGTVRVVANKIYTSHGAGAIGASNLHGTEDNHVIVANNMIECRDDGSSNQLMSPFGVVSAEWADVVYNTVSLTAPTRSNVAAATIGGAGGVVISNSRFMNNIVACYDVTNYALSYVPGTQTSNVVSNNVYYTAGNSLNRRQGVAYNTIESWREAVEEDSTSVVADPGFLRGWKIDLRTYNRQIKGVGAPISGVDEDIYGTDRNDTATCPGAFEFEALFYDFAVEALVNPIPSVCGMPDTVEMVVLVRNRGIHSLPNTTDVPLKLVYRIGNSELDTVTVATTIPAEDTVSVATGVKLHLPANGLLDSVYNFDIWSVFASDPNQTNDTNHFVVYSRYEAGAPDSVIYPISYMDSATVTVTEGVDQWSVYGNDAAPKAPSNVYWYYNSDDSEPFHVGPTLTTTTLRNDTVFYVKQHRELPIVRITQVMIKGSNATGVTPSPDWMGGNTQVAVQLTNIGDDTAYMLGDTLRSVSTATSANNKIAKFGDIRLAPGQSIVVQFNSGTSNEHTVYTGNNTRITPAITSNVGFVYRHDGVTVDAVPFNDLVTANNWTNQSVPAYVWSGSGISVASTTCGGVVRTAFNGEADDWLQVSDDNPLFMNTINPAWIRYEDNGCPGEVGVVMVTISNAPTADVDVSMYGEMPQGCRLGQEPVTVRVRNYGSEAISGLQLNYTLGGVDTVRETLSVDMPASGDSIYTFLQPVNLSFDRDSTVTLLVWATPIAQDPYSSNDTASVSILSLYTSVAPAYADSITADYGTSTTLTMAPVPNHIPVWYDYDLNPVDTGSTFTTDVLYYEASLGVSYIVTTPNNVSVGDESKLNQKTNYPSPYQPNNKNAKQQYIYTAAELQAQGMDAGYISAVGFYLDSIYSAVTSVSGHRDTTHRDTLLFKHYAISIGYSDAPTFANKYAWKTPDVYFERDSMLLLRNQSHGWVMHQLDNNFYWDGVSDIVVQVAYSLPAKYSSGLTTRYSSVSNTALYKGDDNDTLISEFTGQGTLSSNRPNIMLACDILGCNGPVKLIKIGLVGVPAADASISWSAGYDTVSYVSNVNVTPKVSVRNLGSNDIDTVSLHYFIDGDTVAETTVHSVDIASAQDTMLALFSRPLAPGRHTIIAVVEVKNDTISSNDTIMGVVTVRFSGGAYTICADSTNTLADFHSFKSAVDTLNAVGIVGPVVFNVDSGVYNETVWLDNVYGTGTYSIKFIGASDTVAARLVGNTSSSDNYVFRMTGLSGVTLQNIGIEARPVLTTVKDANALVIDSCSDITVDKCEIRVKGTIYNVNASCLVINGGCSNLTLTNNVLDSGYCSIKATLSDNRYENILINNNTITNFQSTGIDLNGVSILTVNGNYIRTGASDNSRGMLGIFLTNVDSTISIQKNRVFLLDNFTGSKRGIHFDNVTGSNLNWAVVANNMVSTNGNGAAGLTTKNPAGIYVDGNSQYLNIIFNSVRVNAGTTQNDTRAFYAGAATRNLQVINNIFANLSQSHAYYVSNASSVTTSDYNGYYTNGNTLAFWGAARSNLANLQSANHKDENSVQDEPYFTAVDDLHLLMTNFCARAQYSNDIIDDIDGKIRPYIPTPTIGAHEMDRSTHNMTVLRITEPIMPTNPSNPPNIEGDPVRVKATFYNNGSVTEDNVSWYAYIEGHEAETRSVTRNIGPFTSNQMKTDTVSIPTVLGLIDSQLVRVVLVCDGDEDSTDNTMTTDVYLAPAFDLEAVNVRSSKSGCNAKDAVISITVKNVGFKRMPPNTVISIGYDAQAYYPNYNASRPDSNKLDIPTMPQGVSESYTLTQWLNKQASLTIDFNTPANIYPTDTSLNIKVRLTGWVNYEYDITNTNDHTGASTNSSPLIDSWYSPRPPQGNDVTFPYGTWGVVTASQVNERPISWFRDSTHTAFYSTSGANAYAKSCNWTTTPIYYHDSTYYLQCKSDKGCASYFSPVTVHVGNRVQHDVACEAVLAPLGGRVYMENDTVRVRIANYGTQSKSNIPITFQLRKGNGTNPLQTVTETCTANIGPGQTYVYTFNTLVQFASATTGGNYQLRVWTDLSNDQVRRNDTIRTKNQLRPVAANNTDLDYDFRALAESTYPSRTNKASDTVDIIRFAFNEIDIDLPPLGRSYTNFGAFANPEVPVLHVTRGMKDTAYITITRPSNPNAVERGKVAVYIDFNRNGNFNDSGECVIPATNLYNNTVFAQEITISPNASQGYMRMCVSATPNLGNPTPTIDGQAGHMLNFLLFVDEQGPTKDLSFTQIIEPRNYLIKDNQARTIKFRMANHGRQAITAAEIFYEFAAEDPDSTVSGSFQWTGNLAPGTAENVSLPEHAFCLGTTQVRIWHSLEGDVVESNNSLTYEYHRFHTITLTMEDDFDSLNYWYAPAGYNAYTRNYWSCGVPSKTKLNAAHSYPNAWVTDLNANITPEARGNVSYLYSPIINIMQIHPDTLSFYMARNLLNKSCVYLEYYDFANRWVKVETDSATDLPWYNDTDKNVFTNKNNNDPHTYTKYSFSTNFISGNFQERFQFRIVYSVPMTSGNYGEGCAIDDFYIGRARRDEDLGVIAINKPENPKYGETVYPEVVVKNFGNRAVRQVVIGYTYNGVNLPRISSYNYVLMPDSTATFTLTTPMVLTSSLPDSITINAFTVNSADIYDDNDSTSRDYVILPIDSDISAEGFISPLDRVVTGDSVTVTMRLRNFGVAPVSDATVTYTVNGQNQVTETIDFESILGEPLASREYFNYTFKRKFRATMGVMNVVAYVKSSANEYIYNDTIHKRINGISAITDLAAAAIILDTSSLSQVRVELAIENRGARGANDFEVGFWIDDDSNNVHREIYHSYRPLAALQTGYHLFQTTLPPRSAPYDHITAFVTVPDDNDPANDTTRDFAPQFVDLAAVAVLVEENSRPDCGVYITIRNNGNMAIAGRAINLKANINGNELEYTVYIAIKPGEEATIKFNRNVPKSPQRRYSGFGSVSVSGDSDDSNNQTNSVSVVNYVEGTPTVNASGLVLEQNYPNPFSGQTTIPFSLPEDAHVRFFVMDATGHMVYSTEGFYHSGDNSIVLDMDAFSAGIYYYGIETPDGRLMRKMILC